MIALGLGAIVAAMLLVRRGWAGARGVAWAGWALAAAALVMLGWRDGAWGLAIGVTIGSMVALLIVLHAAWLSQARANRPPREPPSITLPRRPGDLARRLAVFALTVPVAFVAAQWFAFGAQALARRGGAGDADAIAMALGLQPLAWGVVMTLQLIEPGPRRMIVAPTIAALLGTVAWWLA